MKSSFCLHPTSSHSTQGLPPFYTLPSNLKPLSPCGCPSSFRQMWGHHFCFANIQPSFSYAHLQESQIWLLFAIPWGNPAMKSHLREHSMGTVICHLLGHSSHFCSHHSWVILLALKEGLDRFGLLLFPQWEVLKHEVRLKWDPRLYASFLQQPTTINHCSFFKCFAICHLIMLGTFNFRVLQN